MVTPLPASLDKNGVAKPKSRSSLPMLLKPKSSANKNTTLGISFSDDLLELPASPVEKEDNDGDDEDGATAVGADFVVSFVGEALGLLLDDDEDGATAVGADFVGRFVGEALGLLLDDDEDGATAVGADFIGCFVGEVISPIPTARFSCISAMLAARVLFGRNMKKSQQPHTARDMATNTKC
jgi:hypothetical protein